MGRGGGAGGGNQGGDEGNRGPRRGHGDPTAGMPKRGQWNDSSAHIRIKTPTKWARRRGYIEIEGPP